MYPMKISFPGNLIANSIVHNGRKTTFNYPCNSQDQCHPYEVIFKKGLYKIECWGGGLYAHSRHYAYGAHTRGTIYFSSSQKLYLYLGSKSGKFNAMYPDTNTRGGVKSCGATDVRIVSGSYDDFDSLKSRIMVAGGAGGCDDTDGEFGHGGTLAGERGFGNYSLTFNQPITEPVIAPGGTQTSGGTCTQEKCIPGDFGLAKSNPNSPDNGGFGGGGYYAGATTDGSGNGGGGSSFISGHEPCIAIRKESTFDKIINSNNSIHYSELRFHDTFMESGKDTHYQNAGKVEITVLLSEFTCNHQTFLKIYFISTIVLFHSF